MGLRELAAEKQAVREDVWCSMAEAGVSRFPGARGRIPNFKGAEAAAARLQSLESWINAATIKANPDSPQLPVRVAALEAGKLVYMAVPRLREARCFVELDPDRLQTPLRRAASIRGSAQWGRPVGVADLPHIDLVVCGTVAVNREGVRIGKGGGYSDLEMALGLEARRIDDRTVIVTTVHSLQVLDRDLPETEHDFRVDLIVTPDETIACPRVRRPRGILWNHLDDEQISAIPALASRRFEEQRRAKDREDHDHVMKGAR